MKSVSVNFVILWQVLLFVLVLLFGNVSWKIGLGKIGGFMVNNKTVLQSLIDILKSPWIWTGCFFYIVGTLWWFYLMSKEDISYLYPLVSIGYVLGAIVGVFFFKEDVTLVRWVGMGIVSVGFIFLSMK